jgi:hypothetical protein
MASSRARAAAAWSPRRRRRSGSAGTNVKGACAGSSVSATSAAAARASRRSPPSFQAATSVRTASSYATAERARANASCRPEHSAQRLTGQTVGAPQRSHSGGRSLGSAAKHASQSCRPPRRQTTQRCGSTRSRSTETTVRAARARFGPRYTIGAKSAQRRYEVRSATPVSSTAEGGGKRPHPWVGEFRAWEDARPLARLLDHERRSRTGLSDAR